MRVAHGEREQQFMLNPRIERELVDGRLIKWLDRGAERSVQGLACCRNAGTGGLICANAAHDKLAPTLAHKGISFPPCSAALLLGYGDLHGTLSG